MNQGVCSFEAARWVRGVLFALATAAAIGWAAPPLCAQDDEAGPSGEVVEQDVADELNAVADDLREQAGQNLAAEPLSILNLLVKGGWFMIPILAMSLLVVTFTIERFLGLRRDKVLPEELVIELGRLGRERGGFDPRRAYRLCQQYPSAASSVIRAMLLKVGRPHSEVEHTVAEASERAAERLYVNVRWLTLAAAVSPLLGLLGTVWGMIVAFYDTTQLAAGSNKAEALAQGIYTALVTTLCGLVVAIVAAVFAHYFEGRIQALFHQIDELLFNLLPQVEKFEGRVRFSRNMSDDDEQEPQRDKDAAEQAAAAQK